jgi:hypothetical protein
MGKKYILGCLPRIMFSRWTISHNIISVISSSSSPYLSSASLLSVEHKGELADSEFRLRGNTYLVRHQSLLSNRRAELPGGPRAWCLELAEPCFFFWSAELKGVVDNASAAVVASISV